MLTTNGYIPKYSYDIGNLVPGMGKMGFNLYLDSEYAKILVSHKLSEENYNNLVSRVYESIVFLWMRSKVTYYDYGESSEDINDMRDLLYDYRHSLLRFWDDTCLLTNITVPGDRSGLDIERSDFADLKSGKLCSTCVTYHPHNVDNRDQTLSLLIAYNVWCNFSVYTLPFEIQKQLTGFDI